MSSTEATDNETASKEEVARLRAELEEARATLDAIGRGEVDAVIVSSSKSQEVYHLQSADLPYWELVEQMAEGAVSLDATDKVVYCNGFFADLLDESRDVIQGRAFSSWLTAESQALFEAAIAGGQVVHLAAELTSPRCGLIPVSLVITPRSVRNPRRSTVIVSDLRVRQRMTRLTEARDAARAESEAKDRFLAILGHELRNPLAALTTALELIRVGQLPPNRAAEIHERMARQLAHVRMLVDDLLDATRVAQGKIVLKREPLNLPTFVDGIEHSLRGILEARHQRLQLSIAPEGIVATADPVRLEQILVNLITNASRYSPPDTNVSLEIKPLGDCVLLSVRDEGIGLASENLDRIFQPFVQVASSGGLGIGLTLVRQLVELHGGSIRAESPGVGRGTTFIVLLPKGPSHMTRMTDAQPTRNVPSRTTLIVDDNEDMAELLGLLLEGEGFNVSVAHTCAAARTILERTTPDLVLLDVGLPDVSGYDFVVELRQVLPEKTIIAAVTGYSHGEAQARIKAAGFDAHLVKPITVDQVLTLSRQGA